MTSTFRLTSAEFKKIFKRPSIFIMAILLVIAVFISLYTFNPNSRVDNTVDYSLDNSLQYYTTFYSGSTEQTKSDIDNSFLATDEIINYYKLYNDRNSKLNSYYNDIYSAIRKVESETSAQLKASKFNDVIEALEDFKRIFVSFDEFVDMNNAQYDFITITTTSQEISGKTSYTYLDNSLASLDYLIDYAKSHTYHEFIDMFNLAGNGHKTKLEKVLHHGLDYIQTTFLGISQTIAKNYSAYEASVESSKTDNSIRIGNRNALKTALETYQTYFKLVLDNDYPLVLVNKDKKVAIEELIISAIDTISIPVSEEKLYNSHKTAFENLAKLNIINNINTFTNNEISQFEVDNYLINDYTNYQKKVNDNRTAILTKIDNLKNDEAVSNIQFAITEYYLLSEAYHNYIYDKTIISVTDSYEKTQYVDFYKYKLDEFNRYQVNEALTTNKYYIDNNVYENSYLTNFAFNQKSGNGDTNLFDFMYFALELCAVIIMVFAVMLVCSLITGESESGTIKLLLVRPYKRGKIITAKLLATLFFALTFMIFSFIITFVGGYFLFGMPTQNVLAVFNATTAFEINPLGLMGINALSLLLDIVFFVVLALMISILCKNYAASISAVLVVIILNYALNVVFGGTFWYTVLPGMNLHIFKYFGNAFTSVGDGMILQTLLLTSIESSMTFVFSVLANLSYMVIALAISYSVFAKRDF
ncbi:MAG: hypothetical protein E7354_01630 [Clostridiales bacterium]|nr:hypothetical protein [Clostridiales bacterium]